MLLSWEISYLQTKIKWNKESIRPPFSVDIGVKALAFERK